MNTIFEFLNGREYVLNGVHGTFRHEITHAIYPYAHTREALSHVPSKRGMRTNAYREIKRQLRDDWTTDLTDSLERYCTIAAELGCQEV